MKLAKNQIKKYLFFFVVFHLLLLLTLGAQARAAEPVVIFSDGFGDGNTNNWMVVNDSGKVSNWSEANGQYSQLNGVASFKQSFHTGSYSYYKGGLTLTDYEVSVDITPIEGGSHGVMFRYLNNNNYYRLTINSTQGFMRLEKKVNGKFKSLVSNGRGPALNQVHTVTIIVSGPKILVYLGGLGGEPVFSVSDSSHGVGTVALFTQNKVNFDNLTINQLSSTPKVIISNPISYFVKTTGAATLQVSAVAVNVLSGHGVKFVLDGNQASSFIDFIEPYSGQFSGVSQGDHTVDAFIVDGAGQPISGPTAQDMNQKVGKGGKSLAAMGDSITSGVGDNPGGTDGDDASSDGRNISRGFTPILNNLITNYYLSHTPPLSIPVNCSNEGLPGTQSGRGAGNGVSAVGSMKTRHSESQIWLIEYGTNDSSGSMPVLSGKGLNPGDPGYVGSFKDNMQKIITNLKNSGEIPLPAKVPFARNAPSNRIQLIQDYNIVVDELVAANPPVAPPDVYEPPDFYKYFEVNQNQNVFFDNIHPNENGYKSMADCWFAALCQSGILEVPQPATPPPCPPDPCNLP